MPMPLMGKKAQPPTPQELYKARKQREEDEKNVLFPPGLINHGNTCFMNSVLQGLIATPLLSDLVRFRLPDSYRPIISRRSPQLTNGHSFGGEWEQEWVKEMPLGDIFIILMNKSWKVQEERKRVNLSPREVLTRLGAKYDQYLDFRQQDAHELLRHLLDAMRMEELTVIKKRQPRPSKPKRRKPKVSQNMETSVSSLKDTAAVPSEDLEDIPEEERLTSFVDMAFGGQLASILVCEKCKKVSCTYEDFDDISLPIKAEEYEKARRRDRLKGFAKRLRGALDLSTDQPRSSSTPASPTRRNFDPEKAFEAATVDAIERRRSLDTDQVSSKTSKGKDEEKVSKQSDSTDGVKEANGDDKEVTIVIQQDKEDAPLSRKKDEDDSWGRLHRHISMKLGKKGRNSGKALKSRKGKDVMDSSGSQSTIETSVTPSRVTSSDAVSSTASAGTVANGTNKSAEPLPSKVPSTKPSPFSPILSMPLRPSLSRSQSASPAMSILSTPIASRGVSVAPSPRSKPRRDASPLSRPKSPQPPNSSKEESEYLRRLLAEVPTASALPFSHIFRSSGSGNTEIASTSGSWSKVGGVQSVEDCLRMFTAVETLDGENMYGCRRCWKIANGKYLDRGRAELKGSVANGRDDGASSESESDDEGNPAVEAPAEEGSIPMGENVAIGGSRALTASPLGSLADISSSVMSAPSSLQHETINEGYDDSSDLSRQASVSTSSLEDAPNAFAGPHIDKPTVPLISMTAPDLEASDDSLPSSPTSTVADPKPDNAKDVKFHRAIPTSPSRDSLRLPEANRLRHTRQPAGTRMTTRESSGTSSAASSDESDMELDSDAEASTSMQSDSSSVASQDQEVQSQVEVKEHGLSPGLDLSSTTEAATTPSKPAKRKGPKPVIFRRAYKRYLIAKPPPVLVIHLKRFQHMNKNPLHASFFSNLKKLEDLVAFPEYLDLTPYLMPNKSEFGSGGNDSQGKEKVATKGGERFMYRLFAVVVHIGNMLGGHYIAYTALPDAVFASSDEPRSVSSSETSTTATTTESSSKQSQDSESSTLVLPRPPASRTTSFEGSADPKQKPSLSTRKWAYISDTVVKLTTLEEVMKSKAYICMYERI